MVAETEERIQMHSQSGESSTSEITDLIDNLDLNLNERCENDGWKTCKCYPKTRNATKETCNFKWNSTSLVHNENNEALNAISEFKLPSAPRPFLDLTFDEKVQNFVKADCIRAPDVAFPFQTSPMLDATLLARHRLTSKGAVKEKYSIILDIKNFNTQCEPGDSFSFICPNDDDEVWWLLERLNLSDVADGKCTLSILPQTLKKNAALPSQLPSTSTLRFFFTYCLDYRRILSRTFLRVLSDCCSNDEEKFRLIQMSSLEGRDEFETFVIKPNLNLVDLLHAFPSCLPPVTRLIELLPRLLPRPLSISSSTIDCDGKFRFVYSLVDIPVGEGRFYRRYGVCSGHLTRIPLFSTVQIYYRKPSLFRLTYEILKSDMQIIMIGPGTGVAPFLSALGNISKLKLADDNRRWLFFGCRDAEKDFIFRDELENYAASKVLSQFLVCFSREKEETRESGEKCFYVQDEIRKRGSDLVPLILSNGALIFVCGDAKGMAAEVNKAFIGILVEHGKIVETEAIEFIKRMQKENKYVQDIWS